MARFDKDRLIEDDIGHQRLGHVEQVADDILDPFDNGNRVGVPALLENGQVNGWLPVDADHVVLDLRGVLGVTDVLHQDGRLTDRLDREIVDVVDTVRVGCWCRCCNRTGRWSRRPQAGSGSNH